MLFLNRCASLGCGDKSDPVRIGLGTSCGHDFDCLTISKVVRSGTRVRSTFAETQRLPTSVLDGIRKVDNRGTFGKR